MKKIVIKYGLIGGLIVSVFMCLTIPTMDADSDLSSGMWMGYASMLVSLSTIFIGVRKYRNEELNGIISFGKAFKVGFLIALIASTMYVLCWMVLSEFFLTNFMADYAAASIKTMEETGASMEEIKMKTAELEQMAEYYKNPVFKALITYTEILPVGILFALIAAAVFKKK